MSKMQRAVERQAQIDLRENNQNVLETRARVALTELQTLRSTPPSNLTEAQQHIDYMEKVLIGVLRILIRGDLLESTDE